MIDRAEILLNVALNTKKWNLFQKGVQVVEYLEGF
jgi:hypothetical protein